MPWIKHELYEEQTICRHTEHNPPGMVVLKPGWHIYQCPGCGAIQKVFKEFTRC